MGATTENAIGPSADREECRPPCKNAQPENEDDGNVNKLFQNRTLEPLGVGSLYHYLPIKVIHSL